VALCVKVNKKEAEDARKLIIQMGILDRRYRVFRDSDNVFIPVTGDRELPWSLVEKELPVLDSPETDFHRIVHLPEGLRDSLPTSFDVIGDVAIIKVPSNLVSYQESIGLAMIQANPHLRLVLADGGVKGDCRVRQLEAIAGEGGSETVHTEFGVRMQIDPRKVYFNPRLSNERHRIAQQVKDGEVVLDMFAGVGPFPLVIWKNSRPAKVFAVDMNPSAVEYMERNIRLNKADGIVAILGDANVVLADLPQVDRVIMNLPQSAMEFLSLAVSRCKPGAMIHIYLISERESWPEMRARALQQGSETGRVLRLSMEKELKTYSPTMSVYALDIQVH